MKFTDFPYERVEIENTCNIINSLTEKIKVSMNLEDIKMFIQKINEEKSNFNSNSTICSIRNSVNTTDRFYEAEQEYYDMNYPKLSSSLTKLSKVLLNHPLRLALENFYGKHWFNMMEVELKVFDDVIMDELVKESQLCTKYNKLLASCQIEYDGKINNLSQISKYANSKDASVRKEVALLVDSFFASHEEQIDGIYDDLVKVRTSMAQKMGYENYLEFGYARMQRTDYNYKEVASYRKQVVSTLVPVCRTLIEQQAKRIQIENPQAYDLVLEFLDGNPSPKGNMEQLVSTAMKMYSEMSEETKEFFTFMKENELMDLESKPGKQGGGYCTYIPKYQSPFIFANFNETKGDVDVLTHEAGHAFQCYQSSRLIENPDLIWPTMEACEIHSMSMEFFAYPWIEEFFKEDTVKYKISHMSGALTFIPYGCLIDHFQEEVYLNYEMSKEERKACFRKLEKMYTPMKKYDNQPMWNKGCLWYRQSHVFTSPLYYIDYTLAQVCALEFYLNSLDNKQEAWSNYLSLCRLGGSKPFLDLLKAAKLSNPFVDGSIARTVERLLPVINSYNLEG